MLCAEKLSGLRKILSLSSCILLTLYSFILANCPRRVKQITLPDVEIILFLDNPQIELF